MVYRVLIVDDSQFFQSRLKKMINECPQLDVVGIAGNGKEAIDKDDELKPDIITMDYEMPMVDGITAVKTILAKHFVPIVMFSSMTYEDAKITLEALDAGAVDFIPKNFADISNDSKALKKKLHDKLITFSSQAKPSVSSAGGLRKSIPKPNKVRASEGTPLRAQERGRFKGSISAPIARPNKLPRLKGKVKLLAIGASTGGPVAIADIICKLPASFPLPIVVAQHMPAKFTHAFAERLDRNSMLEVTEAASGDIIKSGRVLIAPGGKHLMIDKNRSSVRVVDADERISYKPSVDIFFASTAKAFGDSVLAIVLTGMGADGQEGARLLKQKGSHVWAQDQATSVVYGMPAAVINEQLADAVFAIGEFAEKLKNEF